MKRLFLAVMAALLASAAHAQNFVNVNPEPASYAWWLRTEFNALHTEVRGIPVKDLRKNWCKATEFARELFPPGLLVENGTDVMAASKLAFSLEGSFDGSGTKQTALVGVYETCGGEKGSFFLIIGSGTRKVRFLDAYVCTHCFSALSSAGPSQIQIFHCMECDDVSTVRWDRAGKRFRFVKT
jgi:opacity protein-like surface antigen